MPRGATLEVALVGADRRSRAAPRAVGSASAPSDSRGSICGQRSLFVRVTEKGALGRVRVVGHGSVIALPRSACAVARSSRAAAGVVLGRGQRARAARLPEPLTAGSTRAAPVSGAQATHGLVRCRGRRPTACRTPSPANPVHWVYLIPSDGADNLAAVAKRRCSRMPSQIDAWWRGQDPTRVPRNDLVTLLVRHASSTSRTVRSTRSSAAARTDLESRFSGDRRARCSRPGFASPRTRSTSSTTTGRPTDDNICGQGGSDSSAASGPRSSTTARAPASRRRPSPPTSSSTRSAPCRPRPRTTARATTSGHTCDNGGRPHVPGDRRASRLSAKVLDSGHNDYYGHAGGVDWTAQDSPWLVRSRQPRRSSR